MANVNKVILMGRLTHNPEVVLVGERKKCSFQLAIKRPSYRDANGNWVDTGTDFIPCETWEHDAERLAKSYLKGDEVVIDEAKIKTGSYQKNGVNIPTWVITVKHFEAGQKSQKNQQNESNQTQVPVEESDVNQGPPMLDFGDELNF